MVKNLPANVGDSRDTGSIPGSGKSHGVGNGNPLQYSYLENSLDRGALQIAIHEVTESDTTECARARANTHTHPHTHTHTHTLKT